MNIFAALILSSITWAAPKSDADEFRFYVLRDPVSMHPLKSHAASASHVLNNIFRGFYSYHDDKDLVSELVTCKWGKQNLELRCQLKKNLKYSGGTHIAADDFVRSLTQGSAPDAQPEVSAQLTQVKEVRSAGKTAFVVTFKSPDRDFLYRMASPTFSPIPADITDEKVLARDYATGPYRLKEWERGKSVSLEPNLYYHAGAPVLAVKALVVSDETTAIRLYQTGQLHFHRRVPTEFHEQFKNLPDFFQRSTLRMDYLGFGEELKDYPRIRQALSMAMDFNEFRRAFFALGQPGCFGISKKLAGAPVCYEFKPEKAKALLAEVDPNTLKNLKLKLFVAEQGAESIMRTAQWYQAQWKKNLGLQVAIEPIELGVLTAKLKEAPPIIFRRGVPLDRPTCLAALEPFTAGNPDNYLKLDRPKVVQIAKDLREKDLNSSQRQKLCREALIDILGTNRLLPLGEIQYITLMNKSFAGIALNALNQLDLSKLHRLKPDQSPSDK